MTFMVVGWKKIRDTISQVKGLYQIGLANGFGVLVSGLFWFYMATFLETENYGEISYLIAIASIVTTISLLGVGTSIIVYTAKKVKIQSAFYSIALVAGTISSIVIFFILYDFGVSLYVIGSVMFSLVISETLGKKYYKKYSIYFITQRFLLVGLALGLYFLIGVEGIILGFALSYFPYAFLLYKGFRETRIDFSLLRPRFGFIFNNYLINLSRTLSFSLDKLFIGSLFGFSLLGNYHLGIQLLALLSLVPSIVFQYILPKDASGQSSRRLKKFTILFSVVVAIFPIILAPYGIPLLFPKYEHAVSIIQIISIAIIPRTISYMYISEFLGKEKSGVIFSGAGIYLVIQISLIYILGNIYSINGVALALVIAQTSEAIFLIISKKFEKPNIQNM